MRNKLKDSLSEKNYRRFVWGVAFIIFIMLLGIVSHIIALKKLKKYTDDQAILRVATVKAIHQEAQEIIMLPGNVTAWHESPIYARTNGYIKKWLVDIGDKVKKGDLLAIIETPELDAQLRQAEADLKTAIANHHIAKTTALRWMDLVKTESVSKQERDEKVSDEKSTYAIVKAAKANRDRLKELVGFERVIAPFDGVITSRTTDIGDLIDEGSSAKTPLFKISQINRLRIYVKIPQYYSTRISPNMEVTLHFEEHPGKAFTAKLFQTADAIDFKTRTLLAEFYADNETGELLSGGYTQVHLKLPAMKGSVRLPVNTLLFRAQGLQVGTINEAGEVALKCITISRDFGNEVEVSTGLLNGERVIVNPPDSLESGKKVKVVDGKKHA